MDRVWSKLYVDCRGISLGSPPRFHWWVENIWGSCGSVMRRMWRILEISTQSQHYLKEGHIPRERLQASRVLSEGLGPKLLEGALNLRCAPGSQSQYRDIEFIHRSTARVLESRDIIILTHARCTGRRPYIDLVVRPTPIPDGVDHRLRR